MKDHNEPATEKSESSDSQPCEQMPDVTVQASEEKTVVKLEGQSIYGAVEATGLASPISDENEGILKEMPQPTSLEQSPPSDLEESDKLIPGENVQEVAVEGQPTTQDNDPSRYGKGFWWQCGLAGLIFVIFITWLVLENFNHYVVRRGATQENSTDVQNSTEISKTPSKK